MYTQDEFDEMDHSGRLDTIAESVTDTDPGIIMVIKANRTVDNDWEVTTSASVDEEWLDSLSFEETISLVSQMNQHLDRYKLETGPSESLF